MRFGEKEGVFKGVTQGGGVVAQRAGLLFSPSSTGTPPAWFLLRPVLPEKRGEPI